MEDMLWIRIATELPPQLLPCVCTAAAVSGLNHLRNDESVDRMAQHVGQNLHEANDGLLLLRHTDIRTTYAAIRMWKASEQELHTRRLFVCGRHRSGTTSR